jgi:flagellar protein FliS
MMPNPYQQYQTTQVQTANTGELIVLLYDGAVRFLTRARLAVEEGRLDSASADLVRGQEIILELVAGLDYERGGDLAANLGGLYRFMYETLLQANLKKDTDKINAVIRLLDGIRDAWRTVVKGAPGVATPSRLERVCAA